MKISKLFMACSLVLFGACTSIDDAETAKVSSVTANIHDFQDEEGTRTVIGVDQNDQLSYRWGVGDVLGIYPDQGTQVAFELSAGSLSADGLSATFDGGAWALKSGHSYYSYFPFNHDCFDTSVDKTCIPVSYLGQQQVDFNDTSNAGQYDFNAAGATSSSTGALSFDFHRLGALLRVKFTLPETGTYQTLVLSTDADVLPVSGKVDLTASTIAYIPETYASSLTIDLNNASGTVGQTAYVYMMLPPMTLKTLGKTLTATLNYGSKSTTYSLCTANSETVNTPDFKADVRYKRDAVYLSGDPAGNMSGGSDEEDEEHEYVDLGLPSGTLWATCNVGANAPEEYGDYFAWGETTGYGQDTSDGHLFGGGNYKWYNGSESSMTKYCVDSSYGAVDDKTTLDPEDDAAHVNWGGSWRMPTKAEQDELRINCTWTWTTQNGVKGYRVVGPNGNSIFLPAAGHRAYNYFNDAGERCYYWSSSLHTSRSDWAYEFGIDLNGNYWDNGIRQDGESVRPVQSKPHEYVDLGLSVKWATMNVGANAPEEYGDYFAWGETEPYYTAGHAQESPCTSWKTGKSAGYQVASYKWCNGSMNTMNKYCTSSSYGTVDNKTTLDPEDDAAHVNWGGSWRMPTMAELLELRDNCTWTWTTQEGVNGYKVVGPNGNSIFLPAAGYRDWSFLSNAGSTGDYWSSSLYTSDSSYTYYIILNSSYFDLDRIVRYYGRSVRAVCP